MHEVLIYEMDDGNDGILTSLGKEGLKLPATPESIDNMMKDAGAVQPYAAYSYTFRLDGLNGKIIGPQKLDSLNAFATQLSNLSEYERVKLEGAAMITGGTTIHDCTKLLHNLDNFEIAPDAGCFELFGHHLALYEFSDSLKGIPQDMMKHFDYAKLGRLLWDEHMDVFASGHRIWYNGKEMREPDSSRDPLACALKIRLCSDANPDGVWIKFPLQGAEDAMDAPERSGEIHVAMTNLGANLLEDCHAVECISEYPGMNRCLETHAGEPLANLLWKAQNFGYAECELGQFGNDAYNKFAAALEYEDCSNLDFAVDITQNLDCYDFTPSTEIEAERYLADRGVDEMLASCFDLRAIGDTLTAHTNAKTTATGMISRNDKEFIYDYYQPKPAEPAQKNTIRLFCPLEVKTDPESTLGEEYGIRNNEFGYATIPNNIAEYYRDEILKAIDYEREPEEGSRGLAHYLNYFNDKPYTHKVSSIHPTVEVWNRELWGVMEIETTAELTQDEMADLTDWCIGQLSDGWGEGFEQRDIRTQDGDISVSFWQSDKDYFLKPEQEFKGMEPEMEIRHEPTMGGY